MWIDIIHLPFVANNIIYNLDRDANFFEEQGDISKIVIKFHFMEFLIFLEQQEGDSFDTDWISLAYYFWLGGGFFEILLFVVLFFVDPITDGGKDVGCRVETNGSNESRRE